MFAGIIEATLPVLQVIQKSGALQIQVKKPHNFNDLNLGDSIAVNGVCLTLEAYDTAAMQFTLAAETLHITQWSAESLQARPVNLERSLRMGDRIHGHWVSGHVDGLAKLVNKSQEGESLFMTFQIPNSLRSLVWKKGSVALNGVSLTINEAHQGELSVCLIPETLKRTNLNLLQVGDFVNIEADAFARALLHFIKEEKNLELELHS